ncbi:peptidoglycan endopeptidase [Sphingomonas sp. XXL09]|uniref:peptidoglycan endopeptidase n=1 Tax=Sphingomonas sp. XXL09 TaxID=3457787 RepID=UPI00406BA05E
MSGRRGAAAALALVGAPFRLHGRDPSHGVDCVGVAVAALRAGGWRGDVPSGYALRGGAAAAIGAQLDAALTRCDGAAPGDVLLFDLGAGQLHFAVRMAAGIVHADAALRRVVERPGADGWRLVGAWRWSGEG